MRKWQPMEEKYLLLLPSFGQFLCHILKGRDWNLIPHAAVCRCWQRQRSARSFVRQLWPPPPGLRVWLVWFLLTVDCVFNMEGGRRSCLGDGKCDCGCLVHWLRGIWVSEVCKGAWPLVGDAGGDEFGRKMTGRHGTDQLKNEGKMSVYAHINNEYEGKKRS